MTHQKDKPLPKGAFALKHEQQLALIPWPFKSYWKTLARQNGYYNHKFMVEWAEGLEDELVLEAGCGCSTTLGEKKEPLRKLVGIDPLREDAAANTTVHYRVTGILEALPFADESFSGAYSDSVFEHIDDPALVCGEMYRVTRPGGRVIINTNSVFNPFMFPNKFMTFSQREWVKRKLKIQSEGTYRAPYRINTKRRLIKYLREAGFTEIKVYRWGVPAMYRPKFFLVLQLLMELIAETPIFCGLKHRLMATAVKPIVKHQNLHRG